MELDFLNNNVILKAALKKIKKMFAESDTKEILIYEKNNEVVFDGMGKVFSSDEIKQMEKERDFYKNKFLNK
jgi:hypothetical protein